MTKLTLKQTSAAQIAHEYDDIFQNGRFRMWKKGEISNPKWLKRDNGYDFLTMGTVRDVECLERYLSRVDERLCAQPYNAYSTGFDSKGNEMVGLYDTDEHADARKVALIVCTNTEVALRVVALAEQYINEE